MGSSTLGRLGNSYVVGIHGPLFLWRVIENEEIPIWVPPMLAQKYSRLSMRALESFLPQIQRTWGDLSLGGIRLLALGELVVWGKKHSCR